MNGEIDFTKEMKPVDIFFPLILVRPQLCFIVCSVCYHAQNFIANLTKVYHEYMFNDGCSDIEACNSWFFLFLVNRTCSVSKNWITRHILNWVNLYWDWRSLIYFFTMIKMFTSALNIISSAAFPDYVKIILAVFLWLMCNWQKF